MGELDLDAARVRLEVYRKELVAEQASAAESTAPVELDQARMGRLSRMDSMQQQAMALEQARRRDVQLKRVDGAFGRIEKGTYGQCVTCSSSIEPQRMEFDPTVFFCRTCASKAERS